MNWWNYWIKFLFQPFFFSSFPFQWNCFFPFQLYQNHKKIHLFSVVAILSNTIISAVCVCLFVLNDRTNKRLLLFGFIFGLFLFLSCILFFRFLFTSKLSLFICTMLPVQLWIVSNARYNFYSKYEIRTENGKWLLQANVSTQIKIKVSLIAADHNDFCHACSFKVNEKCFIDCGKPFELPLSYNVEFWWLFYMCGNCTAISYYDAAKVVIIMSHDDRANSIHNTNSTKLFVVGMVIE